MQLGSDTVVARTKPGMLLTIILILTLLLLPEMISGAESFQKIRVGLPSLALTYMPFYVAQEKGLLRKSGLEAEYIQMNTGIQPQAIMGGNINFFPSLSTGILAAVSGLPLVVVLNFYELTPWMLVTIKEINKPAGPHWQKDRYLRYSNVATLFSYGVVQEG